jgi:hypothetical protein
VHPFPSQTVFPDSIPGSVHANLVRGKDRKGISSRPKTDYTLKSLADPLPPSGIEILVTRKVAECGVRSIVHDPAGVDIIS